MAKLEEFLEENRSRIDQKMRDTICYELNFSEDAKGYNNGGIELLNRACLKFIKEKLSESGIKQDRLILLLKNALPYFNKATLSKLSKEDHQAFQSLLAESISEKHLDEIILFFKKSIKLDKSSINLYYKIGYLYILKDCISENIKTKAESIKNATNNFIYWVTEGQEKSAIYKEKIEELDAIGATRLAKDFQLSQKALEEAEKLVHQALLEKNNPDNALILFNKSIEYKGTFTAFFQKGLILEQKKKYKEALECFKDATEKCNIEDDEVYVHLGIALLKTSFAKKKHFNEINYYKKYDLAKKNGKGKAEFLNLIFSQTKDLDCLELTIKYYGLFLDKNLTHSKAHQDKGILHLQFASILLNEIVKNSLNFAYEFQIIHHLELAITHLTKAIKYNKNSLESHIALITTYKVQGLYEEAIKSVNDQALVALNNGSITLLNDFFDLISQVIKDVVSLKNTLELQKPIFEMLKLLIPLLKEKEGLFLKNFYYSILFVANPDIFEDSTHLKATENKVSLNETNFLLEEVLILVRNNKGFGQDVIKEEREQLLFLLLRTKAMTLCNEPDISVKDAGAKENDTFQKELYNILGVINEALMLINNVCSLINKSKELDLFYYMKGQILFQLYLFDNKLTTIESAKKSFEEIKDKQNPNKHANFKHEIYTSFLFVCHKAIKNGNLGVFQEQLKHIIENYREKAVEFLRPVGLLLKDAEKYGENIFGVGVPEIAKKYIFLSEKLSPIIGENFDLDFLE